MAMAMGESFLVLLSLWILYKEKSGRSVQDPPSFFLEMLEVYVRGKKFSLGGRIALWYLRRALSGTRVEEWSDFVELGWLSQSRFDSGAHRLLLSEPPEADREVGYHTWLR